jgi:hypothetical protein
LYRHEVMVVVGYFEHHKLYEQRLRGLLQSEIPLSKAMRQFLFDRATGVAKRKQGRPCQYSRNKLIFDFFEFYHSCYPDLPVRPNAENGDSVAAKVARLLGDAKTDDELANLENTIVEIYYKLKRNGHCSSKPFQAPDFGISWSAYNENGELIDKP